MIENKKDLKIWRLQRSLTQNKAAELLGVALVTYKTWESSKEKIRPIPKIAKRLTALIDAHDRLKLQTPMPPLSNVVPLTKLPGNACFVTARQTLFGTGKSGVARWLHYYYAFPWAHDDLDDISASICRWPTDWRFCEIFRDREVAEAWVATAQEQDPV